MEFSTLYQLYWQKAYRLCMGYVNDSEKAKDLAQESFITILQALPKFRNEASIGTWVFRIVSNHCLKEIRKDKKLQTESLICDIQQAIPEESDSKKMDLMYQCISELPEVDRIIISLELEELDQASIAEVVGISPGNVRVRIHRIKQKLTQKLVQYGNE